MKTRELAITGFAVVLAALLAFLWFTPSGAQKAPAVTVEKLGGGEVSLSGLHGHPVLVTFWATTCPGCIKEMPHLIQLQNDFGHKGLAILAIAMSYDPPDQVHEMVTRRKLPYTVALDRDGRAARAFGNVQLTPTTFLIDPNGAIVQQTLGDLDMGALKARIESMLPTG